MAKTTTKPKGTTHGDRLLLLETWQVSMIEWQERQNGSLEAMARSLKKVEECSTETATGVKMIKWILALLIPAGLAAIAGVVVALVKWQFGV